MVESEVELAADAPPENADGELLWTLVTDLLDEDAAPISRCRAS
jgi:hypothetical protein